MSLSSTIDIGYGFLVEGENSSFDLSRRLGLEDGHFDSWPETETLESLGFPGLSVIERLSMGDKEAWAICITESHHYIDSKYEEIVLKLNNENFNKEHLSNLYRLRAKLFGESVNGWEVETPEIGWFFISSVG